jgi:hypothetical protein
VSHVRNNLWPFHAAAFLLTPIPFYPLALSDIHPWLAFRIQMLCCSLLYLDRERSLGWLSLRSINEKDWIELKMKSFREEMEVQNLLTGFEEK